MGSVQQTLFQNRTMGVVNVCLSVFVCQCLFVSVKLRADVKLNFMSDKIQHLTYCIELE